MEVNFVEKKEFMLVGLEKYARNDFKVISECWAQLHSRIDEIKNRINTDISYGFQDYSKNFDIMNLSFNYIAAVEVSSLDYIPKGMVGKLIPASKYAVFTYRGSKDGISNFTRNIYNMWFSEFEYELNDDVCGDFEYYDSQCNNTDNSKVDIYIPIK